MMTTRAGALVLAVCLGFVLEGWADPRSVIIEDWAMVPIGVRGVPPGWRGETWGWHSMWDLTVVEDAGSKVLLLHSRDDRSTISKDLGNLVDLRATPILRWHWKVTALPAGGDARKKATTDQAAQLYVVWPRFPGILRSRIIGYAWDTTAPPGSIVRSQKTGTVTYVIVRSGTRDLGQWLTERRDVWTDYMTVFGDVPDNPNAIALSIDSDDTHTSAESLIGTIRFRPR